MKVTVVPTEPVERSSRPDGRGHAACAQKRRTTGTARLVSLPKSSNARTPLEPLSPCVIRKHHGRLHGFGRRVCTRTSRWRVATLAALVPLSFLSCATQGKVSGQLITTMALSTPPETSPHPATLYGVLDYKVRKYLCEPMSRMGMSPGDLSFDIGKLIVVGHCSTPDPSGASWTTTTVVLQLYIDDPATHTPQLLFESRGANSAPEVVFSDLLDTGVRGVAYRDGVTILTGILADCVRHDLLVFRVRLAFHHEGEPPRHVDLQLDFPWGVDVDLEAGG